MGGNSSINKILNDTNRDMMNIHNSNEGVVFTNSDIAKILMQQEVINANLQNNMETLTTSITSLADDIKIMSSTMKNQEVLLERIGNTNKLVDDNNKRVHKRIDSIEFRLDKEIAELKKEQFEPLNSEFKKMWWWILGLSAKAAFLGIGLVYSLVKG